VYNLCGFEYPFGIIQGHLKITENLMESAVQRQCVLFKSDNKLDNFLRLNSFTEILVKSTLVSVARLFPRQLGLS